VTRLERMLAKACSSSGGGGNANSKNAQQHQQQVVMGLKRVPIQKRGVT
jgi:hypothetical protein